MSNWLFAILVITGFVAIKVFADYLKAKSNRNSKKRENAVLSIKKPLTQREVKFLKLLRVTLSGYEILCQAPFSSFINVSGKDRLIRTKWFNKIARKRCDFLVCDSEFNPMWIVELDDSSHVVDRDFKRDKLTQSAGIKTIRVKSWKDAAKLKMINGELKLVNSNEQSNREIC